MILPQILSFLFTLGASYVIGQIFRPSAPAAPRDPGSEQRSRANPRAVLNALYGRWTTFGQEIYLGASTDSTRGFYAIALGIIPPNATISFGRVFADDIQLTLDADGRVISGTDPNGNTVDKYNGLIRVIMYNGGRSTVLEAQPDWNETFIADRVAYAAVELDRDTAAGVVQLPQLRFTGTCDRNNPADAVEDMILDNRYGLAKDASLIGDSFQEHRDYCATEVAHLNRDGTVTVMDERFTVNGEIDCSQSVVDRCNEMLAHQNATLGFYAGKYEIFTNRELTTTGLLDIDEDWFVTGFEFAENSASLFTQLRVDYGRNQNNQFQPGVLYRDVPTTLQHPSQQSRLDTINLPYCDNFIEASRVSAQYINEAFTGLTIRTTLDIRGIQLKPQQLVRLSSERYSFFQKLFQVKEIDELQEGTVLTYRVLFREYEPSNYTDDGTIQEEDPAPNIDFTEPSQIAAVSGLTVINVNSSAETPNFTLRWTVPASLIDEFDVFFGTSDNFATAVRLRTVTMAGGPFTVSDIVAEVISGLPGASYSFWVVGRNEFGRSQESNRAILNWNPVVEVDEALRATRHHENPVTLDPGAPMGADGTGGGWYDPTVGTTITTNRPADPSPHWEATGTGVNIGGANRIVDFTLTGEGGAFETTTTPSAQQYRFTPSGTPGQRVEVSGPRQEITNFTFSGTSSNATGTAGLPDIWDIEVNGTSDATDPSSTTEEFFIYLTGNSSTEESNVLTQADFGDTVVTVEGTPPTGQGRIGVDDVGRLFAITSNDLTNTPALTYFNAVGGAGAFIDTTITANDGTVIIGTARLDSYEPLNDSLLFEGTAGTTAIATAINGLGITTATFELIDDAGSTVQISIPTDGIDETFALGSGLTTATALRNNLLTQLQANVAISNEFTAAAATADARTTGVTVGEPIITLTANDFTDHTIGVTFSNGDGGDLSGSAFGSHVDGTSAGGVSTEIRVTYDPDLTPSFQDIVFGETADSEATASVLSSMINGHGGLSARVLSTPVANLFDSELSELDLRYEGTADDFLIGDFAFTTGVTTSPETARNEVIALPSTRPDNGFIVTQYNAQTTDNFDEEIELAFPGVRTIGTALNLTDVSVFNRRLLVDTGNFTASYFIQRVAVASNDSRLQYFEITGGRDVDAQEQLILDAIPRNRAGPDAVTIISSEQDTIVRVTTTVRDNLDQPTITTTTAGTTQNPPTFTISTFQDGEVPVPGLGTLSSYSISYAGTEVVASTALPASSTAAQVSGLISAAVNSLNTHTTTGTNPFTATSVANSADNLVVTITRGQNSDLSVPTIAVARNVTQEGDADSVFGGSDGTVEPLVGNRSLGVINIAGMSLNDIAIAVGQAYANDGAYLGQTTGPELEITAQFTGTMNPATVNVNAGTNSDGTAANFVIARTVIDDGQGTTVTTGSAASYIILLDTTQVATGTFASNVSSSAVVTTLVNALTAVESFSGSANGDTLRATSSTPTRMPDITITVTPGTDADGTPGTLAIGKTVVQEGEIPRVDYSTTVWSYYVINQEVRVDDDTVMMGADNAIAVNRGLILDTQTWDDVSNVAGPNTGNVANTDIVYFTESFTTGPRNSIGVANGSCITTVNFSNSGTGGDTIRYGYTLQSSVDNGQTWVSVYVTPLQNVVTPTGFTFTSISPLIFSTTSLLTPNTTYWFRLVRGFQINGVASNRTPEINAAVSTNFLGNLLAIEELLAN